MPQTAPNLLPEVKDPACLDLAAEHRILYKALLSRHVEEALLQLFAKGSLFGTVHTCIGQEFSGAVITEFLRPGDAVFSNHRCHGHFLSFTQNTLGLIAEIMGKANGVCGGKGGSQHLCESGFYSNGIQGGIVPVAAGLAMARKLNAEGSLAVVFIGDGTLGEGVLYETLNIASRWALPLWIVLEANGYAQSTDVRETLAGEVEARAKAFEVCFGQGDTWNWKRLHSVAGDMASYVRKNCKPALLQVNTFRLKAHSKGDDNRSRAIVERFEKTDPLNLLLASPPEGLKPVLAQITQGIDQAIKEAERAPFPSKSRRLQLQTPVEWTPHCPSQRKLVTALNEAFKDLMLGNPKIFFIGEDVLSPYGGAFKVSRGLSELFPSRVLNTPISEAAIVGLGSGLALEGFRPFIEIMFGDFLGLAFDQILNHACKFEQMYNGKVKVNLVIRTPMGGGRGYGPTHSQTLEKHFMGIPGLTILALNNLMEPQIVLERLAQSDTGPTLLIENKLLYTQHLRHSLPEGFVTRLSNDAFPTVHIEPLASHIDLTLVGYGGLSEVLVNVADRLFLEQDLIAQILVPTQLYPFEIKSILPLVQRGKSSSLVVIEEGQGFASFGSEFIAQIAERGLDFSNRILRILPPEQCIPASRPLENEMLPSVESILKEIVEWIHGHRPISPQGKHE